MTEISIENQNDKNIDKNLSEENSTNKQSKKQNSDLLKNEIILNNNIIEYSPTEQSNIIHPTKFKLYTYVGRTLFIFLDKYSNPIFIIGPHWPMIIFVISIISIPMLLLYIFLWKYLSFVIKLFGAINFWVAFLSYTYTAIINPGYPRNTIERKLGLPKNDYYFCEYCRFYMRKTAYGTHCDLCDICIENYDHHCMWTGHCIGKNNKITFVIFVPSIFSLIIYFGIALIQGVSRSTF